MYLGVTAVSPLNNYMLLLTFENGERRRFDMKPYLDKGIFKELKVPNMFNTVRISFDSIAWANNADIDPEVLYSDSVPL
ncbi:hypothetical protein FACS189431_6790 [Alphaproteobacteria bacterium]|nr:hypothetical protein FACS189431_6790 [Alphaproteobacteria bacterium]GHU58316.1 hypothetical protein FACS189411_13540 [Bacteroidia bacterium]